MSLRQALAGSRAPRRILDQLVLVNVRYHSFDGNSHQGQIVVHKSVRDDILSIFSEIEASRFPLGKVIPIVSYGWSDSKSIANNNTSAFNYRSVEGRRTLSRHSHGIAVDVNPKLNPWVRKDGTSPRRYDVRVPGTLTRNCIVVRAFKKRGWRWGGDWRGSKDYQHFDKRSARNATR